MTHLVRIAAATAGIILCTLLPFLPGRYDSLAVPLSLMGQLFGRVGLLLVPIGVLWIAVEHWNRPARKRYVFAITALIASSVIWGIVSLGAFLESLALGLGALALGAYVVLRVLRRLRTWTGATPGTGSAIPLYFVIVPVAVALIQLALAGPVTEFSRGRAIRNSAPLIADIEQYRAVNGRYPLSLVSVNRDYGVHPLKWRDRKALLFSPSTTNEESTMSTRREYTAEFKREAVRLAEERGNRSAVARELDIHPGPTATLGEGTR